jgi:hypothetical protein
MGKRIGWCDMVPLVDEADVLRVIRRDFGEQGAEWVVRLLSGYASVDPSRVRLAILKLAAGNHLRIPDLVLEANSDYRDVLGAAEYPRYRKLGVRATEDEKRRAIGGDWDEYVTWLGRPAHSIE